MQSWIHHTRGIVAPQAHADIAKLGGLHEDLISRQGFRGQVAELYRRHEPTAWKRIEGRLQPLDIDGLALDPDDWMDANGGPMRIFYNRDVSIYISRRSESMTYSSRNADGDEVYFVHDGTGVFYTEFGPVPYEPGDWIVFPKGVTYRVRPDTSKNFFVIFQSVSEVGFADIGPIGRNSPFDPSLIYVPDLALDDIGDGKNDKGEWPLRIKSRGEYSTVFYDFDPIDAEGWKGDLFPFKINIRHYRPIHSERLHIMPSAHGIFQGDGFLIANFLPRPAEGDPSAERTPPYHRNVDFDEFAFVHDGSVQGEPIAPASITHFPQGLHHGFPAKVVEKSRETARPDDRYDIRVIALDTVRPLIPCDEVMVARRNAGQILGG